MNFDFDDEQRMLEATLRRLMDAEYSFAQRRAYGDSEARFSEQAWAQYAELGLLGLPLPEAFGGSARSFVDVMITMAEFGRALALEPYLATVILGAGAVELAGTTEQRQRILPAVIAGTCKLALAHGEHQARYDLNDVATRAEHKPDGWLLHGAKSVVLHGAAADILVVSARTGGSSRDDRGISLFLVDRAAQGLALRTYRTIDGLRAADLVLDGVTLPRDALLGTQAEGLSVIETLSDRAVAALCAEAVGIMQALYETTLDYLQTRKQFGVVLGSFQALQHRMAEMQVHLEQSRSMACLAALSVGPAPSATSHRNLAAAKIQIGRSGRFIGQNAIQLHGGIGVTDEYVVSHLFKRLTMIDRLFGDVDHHLGRFAGFDDTIAARAAA